MTLRTITPEDFIENLIRYEISRRQDDLYRAKVEYDRGQIEKSELLDYEEDVEWGDAVLQTWLKLRRKP